MLRSYFHTLPVKQKLILFCVAVAGMALLLFSMMSAFNQVRIMRQAMQENLTILAESIADLASAALTFADRDGGAEILATLQADRDIEVAAIYDANGTVFASYFRDGAGSVDLPHAVVGQGSEFFYTSKQYKLQLFQPVRLQNKQLGALYLLSNTDRMTDILLNSAILLLIGLLLVLTATTLLAASLQGLITRPVSMLARTARRISEQRDYSLRVEKISDDEIGQLIKDFNTMLQVIEERDGELRHHRQHLEELVKERTEELRAKRDEALAAARAKSEFLANMSHEIRTPMNGIIGVLSLLQDVPMTAEYRRLLESASRSADSLLLIINDILDFSKIEAGKIVFESIPFDLRQLLEETSELFTDAVNLKGLEMICHVPPDLPCRVQGDPTRLRQIITNLLSNAVKFTEQGEVKLQVMQMSRQADVEELVFIIEDTGIGVAEEVAGRLFDKFTQADGSTTRKYGGTGLGLSVCKQLVEQQGGSIGVCSTAGGGARFWFTLAMTIVEETYPIIPYKSLKGRNCLLVEPNDSNREVILSYLAVCEMRVAACAGSGQGLGILAARLANGPPIDLILISQRLPDGDGLQLAETIHQLFGDGAPKMVLMGTGALIKAQLRRAGISTTLLKPIRQLDLYRSLAEAAGSSRARRSARSSLAAKKVIPQLNGLVLLVDDEPINLKIAGAILNKHGLQTEVANSGLEALHMTSSKHYSVVLMDVQMPEMSGLEATSAIRRREREQGQERTIIIAMTANALESTRKRCFEAGMDDFFAKPIKPDVLAERLIPWLAETKEAPAAAQDCQQEANNTAGESSSRHKGIRVWNKQSALAFVGGDEGLLREMAILFLSRHQQLLQAIAAAIHQGNSRSLRDAAHAYKGAVSHFAAEEVRQYALSLENMGKDGELADAGDGLSRLQDVAGLLIRELQRYVDG